LHLLLCRLLPGRLKRRTLVSCLEQKIEGERCARGDDGSVDRFGELGQAGPESESIRSDHDRLGRRDRDRLVSKPGDGNGSLDLLRQPVQRQLEFQRIDDPRRGQQRTQRGHVQSGRNFSIREPIGFEQQKAHANVAHVDAGGDRRQVDLDDRIAVVAMLPSSPVN
jgi:hypothetical protein